MIHNAIGVAVGDNRVMEDMGEILENINGAIAESYVDRTGMEMDEIRELMNGKVDGTWFNAKRALAAGFVDSIIPVSKGKTGGKAKAEKDLAAAKAKAKAVDVTNCFN